MQKPRNKSNFKTQSEAGTKTESCFVLMPFGSYFDEYYDKIFAPAIRSVGLMPIRADSRFLSVPIIRYIWESIRTAKVLLADLSGLNPNVFYELGAAHALEKPVILLAEKSQAIPFDVRDLRVIFYDKNISSWGKDLRKQIEQALQETISSTTSTVSTVLTRSQYYG